MLFKNTIYLRECVIIYYIRNFFVVISCDPLLICVWILLEYIYIYIYIYLCVVGGVNAQINCDEYVKINK